MKNRIKVGLVFGGRSAEHKVSLQSAQSIIAAIDSSKYDVVKIGITSQGKWLLNESADLFVHGDDPSNIALAPNSDQVVLMASDQPGELRHVDNSTALDSIDVLFPVLHGPYGEDGSIQGLAKLANIPCVGSSILSSAIGMDKDFTKRILQHEGIAVADFIAIKQAKFSDQDIERIECRFNYPMFVKPANMGSSIGVSRVNDTQALRLAIDLAFQFDTKLLVEEGVVGREIECAVLGNDDPKASVLGEIIAQEGFYDYQSKYIDEHGALLNLPAQVEPELLQKIQDISIKVFEALECRGLARVDMFVTESHDIIINEVNTLPGFTKISMYPKLWEASGLAYAQLIDQLIQFAIEDFTQQKG